MHYRISGNYSESDPIVKLGRDFQQKNLKMRKVMLQENSFFSQPMIFFGSHQLNEEEDVDDDADENCSDAWVNFNHSNAHTEQTPHIGLFLHWGYINE